MSHPREGQAGTHLLGQGCTILYHPRFITPGRVAQEIFKQLLEETTWQQRDVIIFGKPRAQPRLVAYHALDVQHGTYTYSGLQMTPEPFTPLLLTIKEAVEAVSGDTYDTVLLNYYRDGGDTVNWHSDNEKLYGEEPTIASLSFGSARDFIMRRNEDKDDQIKFSLGAGDLLVMKGKTQQHWQHTVPRRSPPGTVGPRINLTFRRIVNPQTAHKGQIHRSKVQKSNGMPEPRAHLQHRQRQQQHHHHQQEQKAASRAQVRMLHEQEQQEQQQQQHLRHHQQGQCRPDPLLSLLAQHPQLTQQTLLLAQLLIHQGQQNALEQAVERLLLPHLSLQQLVRQASEQQQQPQQQEVQLLMQQQQQQMQMQMQHLEQQQQQQVEVLMHQHQQQQMQMQHLEQQQQQPQQQQPPSQHRKQRLQHLLHTLRYSPPSSPQVLHATKLPQEGLPVLSPWSQPFLPRMQGAQQEPEMPQQPHSQTRSDQGSIPQVQPPSDQGPIPHLPHAYLLPQQARGGSGSCTSPTAAAETLPAAGGAAEDYQGVWPTLQSSVSNHHQQQQHQQHQQNQPLDQHLEQQQQQIQGHNQHAQQQPQTHPALQSHHPSHASNSSGTLVRSPYFTPSTVAPAHLSKAQHALAHELSHDGGPLKTEGSQQSQVGNGSSSAVGSRVSSCWARGPPASCLQPAAAASTAAIEPAVMLPVETEEEATLIPAATGAPSAPAAPAAAAAAAAPAALAASRQAPLEATGAGAAANGAAAGLAPGLPMEVAGAAAAAAAAANGAAAGPAPEQPMEATGAAAAAVAVAANGAAAGSVPILPMEATGAGAAAAGSGYASTLEARGASNACGPTVLPDKPTAEPGPPALNWLAAVRKGAPQKSVPR